MIGGRVFLVRMVAGNWRGVVVGRCFCDVLLAGRFLVVGGVGAF